MKISSLKIQNFRTFEKEVINFSDYTCIVGPNGSGKSSIICALNVLFRNTESPTDVFNLNEEDFHFKNTKEPIKITVTFENLSSDAKKDLKDYVRHDKLIISSIAEWNPDENVAPVKQVGSRFVIEEFSTFFKHYKAGGKVSDLKGIYNSLKQNFHELKDISTKEGMKDALREYEESHPNLCKLVESSDQFYGWSRGVNLLDKYFQWVFIPAVKDPIEEQDETKNTALGKLLNRTIRAKVDFDNPLKEMKNEVEEKYRKLLLNEQEILNDVSKSIEHRLKEWSHPGARFELEWHYDEKKSIIILDPSARVKIGEGKFLGNLARLGHGMQRSFLVAILQELAISNVEYQPTLILAIEEPELYQHPPQAHHLSAVLEDLSNKDTQIILTTHSPYFVSGKGFENIRLTRKDSYTGKTNISHLTSLNLSKILAEALGENPRSPSSVIASVEQIMQPSQNELFFSRIPIFVEGTEDVALLATYIKLLDKWVEFRKYGCHFIVCGGKNSMSRPLAIAIGLNIPFFVIFDGDSDKCIKKEVEVQIKKDNGCLLNLCRSNNEKIPSKNIIESNHIIWKTNFLNEIINEIDEEKWSKYELLARKESSLENGIRRKNPLLISATIEKLWDANIKSKILDDTCNKIINFAFNLSKNKDY